MADQASDGGAATRGVDRDGPGSRRRRYRRFLPETAKHGACGAPAARHLSTATARDVANCLGVRASVRENEHMTNDQDPQLLDILKDVHAILDKYQDKIKSVVLRKDAANDRLDFVEEVDASLRRMRDAIAEGGLDDVARIDIINKIENVVALIAEKAEEMLRK
jgi:hypothetical protein